MNEANTLQVNNDTCSIQGVVSHCDRQTKNSLKTDSQSSKKECFQNTYKTSSCDKLDDHYEIITKSELLDSECPANKPQSLTDIGQFDFINLVILDGTWAQAKGLYCQNEMIDK